MENVRFVQVIRSSPFYGKSLDRNMLGTCNSISEIISLSKKVDLFYSCTKKIFANEQNIKELSLRKIIIIDTGIFHVKRYSFVTIYNWTGTCVFKHCMRLPNGIFTLLKYQINRADFKKIRICLFFIFMFFHNINIVKSLLARKRKNLLLWNRPPDRWDKIKSTFYLTQLFWYIN